MRALIFAFLMSVPVIGNTCTIAALLEPECEVNPTLCERRDLMRLFESADVVFEATVKTVRKPLLNGRTRSLNSVSVGHVWKADGKALDLVEAGWGSGDCTIALSAGTTYVIFAHRRNSSWSILPWVKEPLYVGMGRAFESTQFKALSPHHGEFYVSRTRQSLQLFLKSLVP